MNVDNYTIGYLGPEGTFTQKAAFKIKEANTDLKSYDTISKVLGAVENHDIKLAVVPIENSTEGSVDLTLDLLAHKYDLRICGEIILSITQNLLVNKNANFNDIKVIYSHSQAIAQCNKYLEKINKEIRSTDSTAKAAKEVLKSKHVAAIGNHDLSKIYDLKILDESIQDYHNNVTRFVIVSSTDHYLTGNDKTSIIFSLMEDKPGALYEILAEFDKEKINLTKIESRPSKKGLGDYIFFIDMQGHRSDENISRTLDNIQKKVGNMKVLGSYPINTFQEVL